MPTTSAPRRSDPVLARLHDEWRRITVDIAELRTVASWQLPDGPVDSLDELLERCGYDNGLAGHRDPLGRRIGGPTDVDADEQLLRLLAIAPHDPLAGRIVLQRLIPALCATARRYSTTREQREAMFDDLIANAWTVICTYPLGRRRRFVVSNLVRDTTFSTVVRPTRKMSASELPTPHESLRDDATVANVEPLDELVALLNEALASRSITAADTELLCRLVVSGRADHLARALGVTPRTIRNHRDAVVHRLRRHLAAAA